MLDFYVKIPDLTKHEKEQKINENLEPGSRGGRMILPEGFVYLTEIDPTIIQDVKYFTSDNFLGRSVKGYESPTCILTQKTAIALSKIQCQLKSQSLGLKVFDCYRPQMAVDDFIVWSQDATDQKTKFRYYPNVNKADFFKLGYLGEKSGHTRGSTVDLTIIDLKTNKELDMGTHFDFMDELSHPFNYSVTLKQYQNRQLLNHIMSKNGFIPLVSKDTEWWHFTLKKEPFPDTYFNFPVK
jgi:D-alanyl-D-alanine dipeptidase